MPDPDFEIRGGGRGSSWEGGQSPKKICSALWASVWSKNKGEGHPVDPPLPGVV